MIKFRNKIVLTALCGVASLGLAQQASANNLVINGGFESTGSGLSTWTGGSTVGATGWDSHGYNFLFTPGSADNGTGVEGVDGKVQLWGPGNGSNNGLPATSPDGGNYIAADGAYNVGAITQTISGLTAGQTYAVSFYYAAAQQEGFTGETTEGWTVGLGSETKSINITTDANKLPSHGFSGWDFATLDFTASSTSDVLSFLASGSPSGQPPFSLLDGVTLNEVPDNATMLVSAGILLPVFGSFLLTLRKKSAAQA